MIHFLQQFDYPIIVMVMKIITFLGNESFFLLILPALFWCWKKEEGLPLILFIYSTFLLNTGLKEIFAIPRPPLETRWIEVSGYGFPSGHAQAAMVLWGYLGWRLRSYGWAAILIFLIGLSRIYLGVHSPQDVIGGWSIGFVSLLTGIAIIKSLQEKELIFPPTPTAILFVLIGGMIGVLYPDATVIKISGFFAGISAGLVLTNAYVQFNLQARLGKQLLKILIGIGGALALRMVLKLVFPEWAVMEWLRYGIVGAWVGLGAPMIFIKISPPADG